MPNRRVELDPFESTLLAGLLADHIRSIPKAREKLIKEIVGPKEEIEKTFRKADVVLAGLYEKLGGRQVL